MNVLRKVWEAWKRFGNFMGDLIGRLVLTFFYFTIFVPFGLGVRLFGDPLQMKLKSRQTYWLERETTDLEIEDANKQF